MGGCDVAGSVGQSRNSELRYLLVVSPKALEEVHGESITGLPCTADELGQHAIVILVFEMHQRFRLTYLNSTSIPVVAKMIPVGMTKTRASAMPKKTTPTLV